ncbi:hypothetical protein MMC10_010912 [Thelotrema lepadinum]|nr:hypothetical protein [Thelotrema lepadinum]
MQLSRIPDFTYFLFISFLGASTCHDLSSIVDARTLEDHAGHLGTLRLSKPEHDSTFSPRDLNYQLEARHILDHEIVHRDPKDPLLSKRTLTPEEVESKIKALSADTTMHADAARKFTHFKPNSHPGGSEYSQTLHTMSNGNAVLQDKHFSRQDRLRQESVAQIKALQRSGRRDDARRLHTAVAQSSQAWDRYHKQLMAIREDMNRLHETGAKNKDREKDKEKNKDKEVHLSSPSGKSFYSLPGSPKSLLPSDSSDSQSHYQDPQDTHPPPRPSPPLPPRKLVRRVLHPPLVSSLRVALESDIEAFHQAEATHTALQVNSLGVHKAIIGFVDQMEYAHQFANIMPIVRHLEGEIWKLHRDGRVDESKGLQSAKERWAKAYADMLHAAVKRTDAKRMEGKGKGKEGEGKGKDGEGNGKEGEGKDLVEKGGEGKNLEGKEGSMAGEKEEASSSGTEGGGSGLKGGSIAESRSEGKSRGKWGRGRGHNRGNSQGGGQKYMTLMDKAGRYVVWDKLEGGTKTAGGSGGKSGRYIKWEQAR